MRRYARVARRRVDAALWPSSSWICRRFALLPVGVVAPELRLDFKRKFGELILQRGFLI
jgi:hypothetical protein